MGRGSPASLGLRAAGWPGRRPLHSLKRELDPISDIELAFFFIWLMPVGHVPCPQIPL